MLLSIQAIGAYHYRQCDHHNSLIFFIRHELHVSFKSLCNHLWTSQSNSNAVILNRSMRMRSSQVFQFSKNLEKILLSLLVNSVAFILNRSKKHSSVIILLVDLNCDIYLSIFLIVLHSILDDVEEYQLIQTPISLDKAFKLREMIYFTLHMFLFYLVLKWLQHLFNKQLWWIWKCVLDTQLVSCYLHLLDLVCVVKLEDLGRIHDLFIHFVAIGQALLQFVVVNQRLFGSFILTCIQLVEDHLGIT